MAVDLGVFQNQKSLLDFSQLQQEFEARKQLQAAQIQSLQNKGVDFNNLVQTAAVRKAYGQQTPDDDKLLQAYTGLHPQSSIAGLGSAASLPRGQQQTMPLNDTAAAMNGMTAPQKPAPVASPDGNIVPAGFDPTNLPARPADIPVTGADFLKTIKDPNYAAAIKLVGDGNEKSSTVLSRMPAAQKMSFLGDVASYNPNYSANQFGAIKAFNTDKLGNTTRSLSVSDSHLGTLSDLADALDNGNVQLINKIGNQYATLTGGSAPTNFEAAKQIVADEVVKAVVGAGGTGADREKAAQVISAANSPAQLKGVISTYRSLMKGQLDGLKTQYKTSTGRDDFDTRLGGKTAPPATTNNDFSHLWK